MKRVSRIVGILLLSVAIVFVATGIALAYPTDWTSDNTVPGVSSAGTVDIASRGPDVWVAYRDTTGIKVRKSTNKAVSFGAAVSVEDSTNTDTPQITVTSTGDLYCSYWYFDGTNDCVKIEKSTNGGSSFVDFALYTNTYGDKRIHSHAMTHYGDAPAICWEQSNPDTASHRRDSFYSVLGAGGTLSRNFAAHTDDGNENRNPTIASDGAGKYFITFSTIDSVGSEDAGVWVTRVNGGTSWDHVYTGQYASSGYPSVRYRGITDRFDLTYSHYSAVDSDNIVYWKQWTGSWGSEQTLYNAGTTVPYPKEVPLDGGKSVCRSANGTDLIVTGLSSTDIVMNSVSASAQPRSFAVNAETTTSEVYLATVVSGGGLMVKRTDIVKPSSSLVQIGGGHAYTEGGRVVTYLGASVTSFPVTYNVADDWNLTGSSGGQNYTNGVTSIDAKQSSGETTGDAWGPLPSADPTIDHAPWVITANAGGFAEGTAYIGGTIYDTAGNAGVIAIDGTPASTPARIVVDRTLPTINNAGMNPSGTGWHKTPITITLHGSDTNFLACQYRMNDEGAWTNVANDTPFQLANISGVLYYRAIDKAYNVSESKIVEVHSDTIAPTASITKPVDSIVYGDVNNLIFCGGNSSDTNMAGARLYIDGVEKSYTDTGNPGCYWNVKGLAPNSQHTIKIIATDLAGNTGTAEKRVTLGSESKGSDWYFAEGSTRGGFDEYLCVFNPNKTDSSITFDFLTASGAGTRGKGTYVVKAGTRSTFNVRELAGNNLDVAVKVHAEGAAVIVERPMYFNWNGITGGTTQMGQNILRKDSYFAEGCTRDGFQEYLCLANFGNSDATVSVTYMLENGSTPVGNYLVPARKRVTVNVNAAVGGGHDVSMKVHSNVAIAAERPMYFNNGGLTDGTISGGTDSAATKWYFAEGCTQNGFTEWLTVQNPNGSAAAVTFKFMLGTGKNITANVSVPAHARGTWNVATWVPAGNDVSVQVTSNAGVIAERPMYFNYHGAWTGGHDSIGLKNLSDEWYLAEGTTRNGFEEWITIQNPSQNSCGVHLYYQDNTGIIGDTFEVVEPYSRLTVFVNQEIGAGKDVSCHIISDVPVAVERPMYFNYNGWTGGHISLGYMSSE